MSKKFLKKFISTFLCAIILICTNGNHVGAAERVLNQEYLQINKKINTELEKNIPPEEIFENLSEAEINTLMEVYGTQENSSLNYGFISEVVNNPEVKLIDDLASTYYDYYVEHGELPVSVDLNKDINSDSSDLVTTYAAADYSMIMKDIGYTYTVEQIAAQLVAIGTYLKISSALPFLNLLALVVGMGIIAFTAITVAYCAVAIGANDLILTWYIREAQNLLNARTSTATLVAQKEQGAQFWDAYLVNYSGMGGIRVGRVLTKEEAIGIVKMNQINPNVLAINFSLAGMLGTEAFRVGFKPDEPHYTDTYPLNMIHVHAYTKPGILGITHIFYLV